MRDYLPGRVELPALGVVNFPAYAAAANGGNLPVEWSGADPEIDDAIIEAILTGQAGYAGVSFVSPGRILR